MNRMITLSSALLALSAPAMAEIQIGVGQPGRGYERFGLGMTERLDGAEVVNFEGSAEISEALCAGDVDVGIMQIDAIYARSKEGCRLQVVANYGEEFAFILFPPDSRHDALDDLGAGDAILVDTVGSGTDLFWHNIRAIEAAHGRGTSWINATGLNGPMVLAEPMASTNEIQAVIFVGNPNSDEVVALMDAGWNAGELRDRDIDDETFNGKPLYERQNVKMGRTGFMRGQTNDTYVVPSFVVVTADWMQANRDDFNGVVRAAAATQ